MGNKCSGAAHRCPPDEIAEKLLNIFQEYRNDIKKIDFQMDIERLKNDIQESSKNLL